MKYVTVVLMVAALVSAAWTWRHSKPAASVTVEMTQLDTFLATITSGVGYQNIACEQHDMGGGYVNVVCRGSGMVVTHGFRPDGSKAFIAEEAYLR